MTAKPADCPKCGAEEALRYIEHTPTTYEIEAITIKDGLATITIDGIPEYCNESPGDDPEGKVECQGCDHSFDVDRVAIS